MEADKLLKKKWLIVTLQFRNCDLACLNYAPKSLLVQFDGAK